MPENLKYSVEDRIATIAINRPEARNAITPEMIAEIVRLVRQADADPAVKCILLDGEGEHFCAGGDVKGFSEFLAMPADERFDTFERKLLIGNRLPKAILEASKPVVVSAKGAVAGAGMGICLAADFVICGQSSYFLAAHILIGISLDCGLSSLLVGAMGIKAAKRLAFLGESIQAKEALELGIVTRIVPDSEVTLTAITLCRRLANGPSTALAGTKSLLNDAAYPTFVELIAKEATMVARATAQDDFRKGITAAMSKKQAQFD